MWRWILFCVAISLPAEWVTVEEANVPSTKNRRVAIQVENPRYHDLKGELGGCAVSVYGDAGMRGRIRLVLRRADSGEAIHTLVVDPPYAESELGLPIRVADGHYRKIAGKPRILDWRDLTGDGVADEIVLFDYMVCGIPNTTVIGYRPEQDQLVQFDVVSRPEATVSKWTSYVFQRQPDRPGFWSFDHEWGHGDNKRYRIVMRYDRQAHRFERTDSEIKR